MLANNTNHCTTYHTWQSCHTKLVSTNQQKSLFLQFFFNNFHSSQYHVHIPKTLNTSSIPVDYVNQTLDTCPYAYIQMQSMTTSSEIHGYLSQSRFTTSKTLCNYSIFCRCLDTLFKTVNFQLKTLLAVI